MLKYSPGGELQWVVRLRTLRAFPVACSQTSNVIYAGVSTSLNSFGTVTMANGTAVTLSLANRAICSVIQFSPAGNINWMIQSDGSRDCYSSGLAVDAADNVYQCGTQANGNSNFLLRDVSGAVMRNLTTQSDLAFVVKYNSVGAFQWAAISDSPQPDSCTSVTLNPAGNVRFIFIALTSDTGCGALGVLLDVLVFACEWHSRVLWIPIISLFLCSCRLHTKRWYHPDDNSRSWNQFVR